MHRCSPTNKLNQTWVGGRNENIGLLYKLIDTIVRESESIERNIQPIVAPHPLPPQPIYIWRTAVPKSGNQSRRDIDSPTSIGLQSGEKGHISQPASGAINRDEVAVSANLLTRCVFVNEGRALDGGTSASHRRHPFDKCYRSFTRSQCFIAAIFSPVVGDYETARSTVCQIPEMKPQLQVKPRNDYIEV